MNLTTVLSRQRRPLLVAALLALGGLWICIPTGRSEVGVFFAVGIFLGLLNHVLTEVNLYRSLDGNESMSRQQFAIGSFGRLALVTALAFAAALAFWPAGAAVFVGLALMHLVILVFTGLPLLNEMRKA